MKYGRIASDPSQIEMFKNDLIDGKIGLPPAPVDGKTYVLTHAHGLTQWVAEGEQPVYPVPEEPEIAPDNPTLMLGSVEDSVSENNTFIMPETTVQGNTLVL